MLHKISSGLLLQWRRADEQTGGMLEMSGARLDRIDNTLSLVLGTWKKETENKELLIYYHRTLSLITADGSQPACQQRAVTGESIEHWSTGALRIRDLVSQQGLAL